MDVADRLHRQHRVDEVGFNVVGLHQRQPAVDLDVGLDLEVGPVVEDRDVVDALDVGVGTDFLDDAAALCLRGGGPDQVGDVLAADFDALVDDQQADQAAGDGVEQRIADEDADDPEKRRGGSLDIVETVDGQRLQCRGVDGRVDPGGVPVQQVHVDHREQ